MQWIWVFLGGGLGSVLRFALSHWWVNHKNYSQFPLATVLSNLLACLLLGVFAFYLTQQRWWTANYAAFWMVGFCGGFSTFSTFSLENLQLVKNGLYGYLSANILISLLGGLVLIWLSAKFLSE